MNSEITVNHPYANWQYSDAATRNFVYAVFFNLTAFAPAASDDPDAP
jgi:hypothetical protein